MLTIITCTPVLCPQGDGERHKSSAQETGAGNVDRKEEGRRKGGTVEEEEEEEEEEGRAERQKPAEKTIVQKSPLLIGRGRIDSRESQEHAKKESLAEEEGGEEDGASAGSAPKPLATRSVCLSVWQNTSCWTALVAERCY